MSNLLHQNSEIETGLAQVSIIINNYNYGSYLGKCVDSALDQDYQKVEVIVVDDGSTDDSAVVIQKYGSLVISIRKSNGGQGSAFNEGFRRSQGEVIIFLDADDLLDRDAASTAVELLADPEVVKAHWLLREIDSVGNPTGRVIPGPARDLPHGDHTDKVRRCGPGTMRFPPTSGHAWKRSFLDLVLPMNEEIFRIGADTLLFEVAPFVGLMNRYPGPLGSRRIHGRNDSRSRGLEEQMGIALSWYKESSRIAAMVCGSGPKRGRTEMDRSSWERAGWWPRLQRAVNTVESVVPDQSAFVLIDEDTWGIKKLGDRPVLPLPMNSQGRWNGIPESGSDLIETLDSLAGDVEFVVVAWNAYWWLNFFGPLSERLSDPIVKSEDVSIFRLTRFIK
jgi:glycosyltransferase involved in cell wall biosynthesis